MNKKSQCIKILSHIKQYGSIEPMTALNRYGVMRLASRINDLKEAGYNIVGELEHYTNSDGEKKTYKRYWIKEEG